MMADTRFCFTSCSDFMVVWIFCLLLTWVVEFTLYIHQYVVFGSWDEMSCLSMGVVVVAFELWICGGFALYLFDLYVFLVFTSCLVLHMFLIHWRSACWSLESSVVLYSSILI
ncbi:hypothetical protein Dimus_038535 [Dionaea muscipula]